MIARGDNVMSGYLNDPEPQARRSVEVGYTRVTLAVSTKTLVLVGRRKELIVTSSGKNVYPDELEPLYGDHDLIEELCIVGIPDPQGDERVAALIVPIDDAPSDYQSQIKALRSIAMTLSDHKKLRTLRFWPERLPRTPTRKIERAEVREELIRLLSLSKSSRREGNAFDGRERVALWGGGGPCWR